MATSKQRLEYEVRLKDLATKDLKRASPGPLSSARRWGR
jgi:hypothetical protein